MDNAIPDKKFLSRVDILNADDATYYEVECPEWGGNVLIRGLTGYERDSVEVDLEKKNLANFRARIAQKAIVDPENKPNSMFSTSDIKALGNKNAKPLDRIFMKVLELSGLRKEDVEVIKEELKNE